MVRLFSALILLCALVAAPAYAFKIDDSGIITSQDGRNLSEVLALPTAQKVHPQPSPCWIPRHRERGVVVRGHYVNASCH